MATAKKKAPAKKAAAKKAATKRAPAADAVNGIALPREGTDSAKVWAIADEARKQNKGKCPVRSEVLAAATKAKVNEATAATQFARWRTYNGFEGRTPAAAA